MKLPEIKATEKTVVVIGLPACGKTTVTAGLLEKYPSRKFKRYSTDDYIPYGFEQSLYVMLDDLKKDLSPYKIIEGVQGYRLLRKGLQLGTFKPDLVIVCVADKATRQERFAKRPPKDTGTGKKRQGGFDGMLNKIWNDYLELLKREPQPPRFIIFNTVTEKARHA